MNPIEFPEQTTVWAKDGQPDDTGKPRYKPLPAYSNDTETISCWRLTWRERIKILFTGRLWLRQMNFGKALQPQAPCIDKPFEPVSTQSSNQLEAR